MAKALKLEAIDLSLTPSWRVSPGTGPTPEEKAAGTKLLKDAVKYGTMIARPRKSTLNLRDRRQLFIAAMEDFYRLPTLTKEGYIITHEDKVTKQKTSFETGYMFRLAEKAEKTPEYDEYICRLTPENMPMKSSGRNIIERWMHPAGPLPPSTEFEDRNLSAVDVKEVPGFLDSLTAWGYTVNEVNMVASEYLAVALGLPPFTFTDMMFYGPHRVAPTGVNLAYEYFMWLHKGDESEEGKARAESAYGELRQGGFKDADAREAIIRWLKEERVLLDAFHNDLNFWTIHAMSNSPGLIIFQATGDQVWVDGLENDCLLIQTGRQLRHLTDGMIPAMYHEVVTTAQMLTLVMEAFAKGVAPIRVGCPFFAHISSDQLLAPLFWLMRFRPDFAGQYVRKILAKIYADG